MNEATTTDVDSIKRLVKCTEEFLQNTWQEIKKQSKNETDIKKMKFQNENQHRKFLPYFNVGFKSQFYKFVTKFTSTIKDKVAEDREIAVYISEFVKTYTDIFASCEVTAPGCPNRINGLSHSCQYWSYCNHIATIFFSFVASDPQILCSGNCDPKMAEFLLKHAVEVHRHMEMLGQTLDGELEKLWKEGAHVVEDLFLLGKKNTYCEEGNGDTKNSTICAFNGNRDVWLTWFWYCERCEEFEGVLRYLTLCKQKNVLEKYIARPADHEMDGRPMDNLNNLLTQTGDSFLSFHSLPHFLKFDQMKKVIDAWSPDYFRSVSLLSSNTKHLFNEPELVGGKEISRGPNGVVAELKLEDMYVFSSNMNCLYSNIPKMSLEEIVAGISKVTGKHRNQIQKKWLNYSLQVKKEKFSVEESLKFSVEESLQAIFHVAHFLSKENLIAKCGPLVVNFNQSDLKEFTELKSDKLENMSISNLKSILANNARMEEGVNEAIITSGICNIRAIHVAEDFCNWTSISGRLSAEYIRQTVEDKCNNVTDVSIVSSNIVIGKQTLSKFTLCPQLT